MTLGSHLQPPAASSGSSAMTTGRRAGHPCPAALLTIMKYVFYGQEETFDRIGAPLAGIFPFVSMFLVTSIAMLRERTPWGRSSG